MHDNLYTALSELFAERMAETAAESCPKLTAETALPLSKLADNVRNHVTACPECYAHYLELRGLIPQGAPVDFRRLDRKIKWILAKEWVRKTLTRRLDELQALALGAGESEPSWVMLSQPVEDLEDQELDLVDELMTDLASAPLAVQAAAAGPDGFEMLGERLMAPRRSTDRDDAVELLVEAPLAMAAAFFVSVPLYDLGQLDAGRGLPLESLLANLPFVGERPETWQQEAVENAFEQSIIVAGERLDTASAASGPTVRFVLSPATLALAVMPERLNAVIYL